MDKRKTRSQVIEELQTLRQANSGVSDDVLEIYKQIVEEILVGLVVFKVEVPNDMG